MRSPTCFSSVTFVGLVAHLGSSFSIEKPQLLAEHQFYRMRRERLYSRPQLQRTHTTPQDGNPPAQWISKCGPGGPAASAESSLEMQILQPHPDPRIRDYGGGVSHLGFKALGMTQVREGLLLHKPHKARLCPFHLYLLSIQHSTWHAGCNRWLSPRAILPPGDIWQCLESAPVVTNRGRGCKWHLVG